MVRKLLGDLEEAGHTEKVNFKPLVVSPQNLVPKNNGSHLLIHNLKSVQYICEKRSIC